ncbi:MAG TPA: ABC transporter substrate-binding protein [Flexivirga sp.]|uniref:ABC transporter substrate-binding protein n=1 Tax=Flexivirga sp. TaxID=1962927 RepID=UPI002C4408E2|nr:ABC transporter substrate-binding protein [Flexivirga sp.]HWC24428.1 ABC transporter substrate-binding protein [Flexivirga sp.]
MHQKLAGLAAIGMAGALALSGCATKNDHGSSAAAGGGGAASSGTVKIMVGGMSKVIYMPAALTQQLGYFKDEGVKVQLIDTPAGVTAETSLIAGKAQGVVGFYDHTIDMQAKGKCLESVVQFANVPGEVEMVSKKSAGTIKSAKDMKGKKLGVTSQGSSTDFLTQYFTGKAGITTKQYTTVKAGADATFIASMKSGGIDAGMTTDPTVARLTKTGEGKVLFDMRTEAGTRKALGGLYPASSLYMSCEYVKKNPQQVQKVANAFVKTLKWINSHSAQQISDKMPSDYKGSDPALYVEALKGSKGIFNTDGLMDEAGAKNALNVLGSFSPAVKPKKDQIDISKTYTTEFAKKATS